MKDFGYGRKGMREICEAEIAHCVEDMNRIIDRSGRGGSVVIKLKNHFNVYVSNTLWQLMAGKRYDIDDPDMLTMQRILSELFASIDMKGATFSHFPLLRFIAPKMSGYKFFIDAHYNFHNFVGVEVDKHRAGFDPANEPQDLIDAYLRMVYMKANGSNNNEGEEDVLESFSEKQLRAVILDLFLAGSETTNKSTNFMFLHLLSDADMQDKARDEIDRVVGRNRLPTLDDRVK
jgi:cytochrome P450